MRTTRPALVAVLVLTATGCATTLSTHQTAAPIPRGHVEANVATGFYVPLGASLNAVAEGTAQVQKILAAAADQQTYELTPEDQDRLITAAIALAVLPPSPSEEITLRTGVLENMDVGLRYSVNAVRLDTKYRLYHREEGEEVAEAYRKKFDVAVGLGVSRYLFQNFVFEALQFIQMNDFSRWDVEVPVYASWEWGHIWRVYTAAKYVYSHTTFDQTLVNTLEQGSTATGYDVTVDQTVPVHFVGATAGVMLGYRWIWIAAELTGGYTYCRPFVAGARRDLGGATIYPSIGVIVRI